MTPQFSALEILHLTLFSLSTTIEEHRIIASMNDLNEFHPFPRLPLELRRKIWLWTLPRPRLLHCCMAKPTPSATHVNFEARNIALEHFEFIPKHAPDGSRTSNCRKSPHKCSWGWIDFKLDHLARSQRLRCNCVSATSLRVKTQNLHLGGFLGFYWEWAMDPARFDARQWAIYRLLHMDKPSVRRILIIVHWKQMQEIPASEHAEVENRFQAVGAVMEKGLAGLEIEEAKILRPGQKARWTDWTAPEIRFQRCPCSWEEKPEADAVYYCRRELNILE